MADLIETTLARPVGASETSLPLVSVAGINRNDWLYLDGETVKVTATPRANTVRVMRGRVGVASAHAAGAVVFAGTASRFYAADPVGLAPASPVNSPWVNTVGRRVWRVQGDAVGPGSTNRVWVLVTITYPTGSLGIRTAPVSAP